MTAGNVATYVVVVLFALSTALLLQPPPLMTKKQLLRSLAATAGPQSAAGSAAPRVAIGYNANVDVIAPAVALFHAAGLDPDVPAREVDVIRDKADLSAAFRHFFSSAAAGERTLANAELLDELVRRAKELSASDDGVGAVKTTVGGNAALMGLQFGRMGCEVMLGGKFGAQLRELLGDKLKLSEDDVAQDEYHLILEYSTGDTWGEHVADRANRFIVSNDKSNGELLGVEGLHSRVRESGFQPDVFVLAGLHLLEAQPQDVRTRRMKAVQEAARRSRTDFPDALMHLELASVAQASFMAEIADAVFPLVDSIGLNEQELMELYVGVGGAVVDESGDGDDDAAEAGTRVDRAKVAAHVPTPASVAVAIRFVLAKYPTLSRVHFHSLGFHLLVERHPSAAAVDAGTGLRTWGSATAAAAAASITATHKACEATEPELHGNDLDLLLPTRVDVADPAAPAADGADATPDTVRVVTVEEPVLRWQWPVDTSANADTLKFVLAPVLVCKEPKQTVGLGDAISATGLAVHAAKQ